MCGNDRRDEIEAIFRGDPKCLWGVKPESPEQQEALPVAPANWALELSPAMHDPSMEGEHRKRGDHERPIAHGF